MKNRLYKGLFAVAISMSCVYGFAAAPVIRDLPSINIGDNENNIGTDNNFFVYTDAFKLDNFVSDPDTPISSIIWSFDEASAVDGDNQWFQINGLDPVLIGNVAIASDEAAGFPAHVNPTANLRAVSNMASFRDVVLSPVSGTPPFTPVDPNAHATGKIVRFYVSDNTPGNVSFKGTLVQSTDNTFDSKSGGSMFVVAQDDTFTTGDPDSSGLTGWAFSTNGLSSKVYSSANHSIGVSCTAQAGKYRSGGWQANFAEWLPYSQVGSDNVVRGKFYMYATGQTAGQQNLIPNFRVRLQERFAVTDGLCVNATNNVAQDTTTSEVAPSQDPSLPSLYRADLAPIDVPFLTTSPFEGIQRFWDLYGDQPQFTGTLAMSESVIGTYPRSLIANTAGTLKKTYAPSDFWTYFPADNKTLVWILGAAGDFPTSGTGQPLPTIVDSSAGTTLDSSAVPSTVLGNPVRDFNPPQDNAGPAELASLERVVEGKQWTVRWHLTSTKNTNRQSHMRLRARALGFAWSHQYEMGGAWIGNGSTATSGGANNEIAQQTHPGIGSQNPDQRTPGENGGWYTQILHTPMSQDIRPDVAGTTIEQKMPAVSALPGPGSSQYVGGADRAWRFGVDILDTLSNGDLKALEEGNVLIDALELRIFDLVDDGGY